MTTHLDQTGHPMHPLVECDGGTYFTGDLAAGMNLVGRDRFVHEGCEEFEGQPLYYTHFTDDEQGEQVAEFGNGPTPEVARRFALGAAMGPIDAEYDESRLIALLQVCA